MELEQEMLLLLYVNCGSELFWKHKPLWTAKGEAAWKCDIVETKATGEWHHEWGYLNSSVTKIGLNCFQNEFLQSREKASDFKGS